MKNVKQSLRTPWTVERDVRTVRLAGLAEVRPGISIRTTLTASAR